MPIPTAGLPAPIRYAGFWRRLAAGLIDSLLFMPLMMPLLFPPSLLLGLTYSLSAAYAIDLAIQLLGTLVGIAFALLFLTSRWQATPGKRLMKVYVGQAGSGARASTRQVFVRFALLCWPYWLLSAIALYLYAPLALSAGHYSLPLEDHRRIGEIVTKWHAGTPRTEEEQQFIFQKNTELQKLNTLAFTAHPPVFSPATRQHLSQIHEKLAQGTELTEEEKTLVGSLYEQDREMKPYELIINGLGSLYYIVLAVQVARSREKKGFHDTVAKTRAFYGRTA